MNERPKICGAKLIYGGYVYSRSKFGEETRQYWDCIKLRSKECGSRIVTEGLDDNVTIRRNDKAHDHPPDREFAAAEQVKFDLKQQALDMPEKGPSGIVRDTLGQIEAGVIAHLPPKINLCRSLRTAKRKNLPPNPKNIDQLEEVPEAFRKTLTGDRFLMWDFRGRGQVAGRVLVFATRRNIQLLAASKIWFLDGTFKVRIFFVLLF